MSRPTYARTITAVFVSPSEYGDFIRSVDIDERIGTSEDSIRLLVVDGAGRRDAPTLDHPGSLPVVVAWVGEGLGAPGPDGADLVVGPDDVDELVANVSKSPLAAGALAVLLRGIVDLATEDALAAESAVYSMLQGGPEFAAWRTVRPQRSEFGDERAVVELTRHDSSLVVKLNRPQRHNAISSRLRDELYAALVLAQVDATIHAVRLAGNGPSFCSGGDLDEFGARPDPATAHVIRLARSPARLVHRLRHRTTVELHGAAFGGGIEIAAFAGRVVADPDTRIALPELGLGLIPGAGGTVSITARSGRQRTAALALVGRTIDARTALSWGLVDEIAPRTALS